MPNVEDVFDRLKDAQWFSKIDAKAEFLQVNIYPRDVAKTAFEKDEIY